MRDRQGRPGRVAIAPAHRARPPARGQEAFLDRVAGWSSRPPRAARVDVAHAGPGSELEVGRPDGLQKRLPATVARFPFYQPEKTRVRA